jgi:acetoin utilization protein AcuB
VGAEIGTMRASELMPPNPRTVRPTDSVSYAVDTLQSMNVRHLPVVDDAGHLIGMISDRDLGPLMKTFMETAEAEHVVVSLSSRPVSDLMSSAIAIELDDDVSEAIDLMLEERVGAVPVVDAGGYVHGIISYVDVLRLLTTGEARIVGSEPSPPAKI